MELFHEISTILVYSGAFFALILAVEQLVSKGRNRINIIGFFAILCNAVFSLNIAFAANGVQAGWPWTSFFFITALYLSGPANFIYYRGLLGEMPDPVWKILRHFILPASAFVFDLFFRFKPVAEQRELLAVMLDPAGINYIKTGILTGVIIIVIYHSYMTREIMMVRDNSRIRPGIQTVIILNSFGIAAAAVLLAGFLFGVSWILLTGGLMLSAVNIMIFFSHSRNPEFFLLLKRELRDTRYRKSMLKGLDVDALHRQLISVMEDGLYRDCDLTLARLSEILGVSKHSLSQLLNERLGKKFSDLINYYRIEEAKRLLQADEKNNVLSVCFYVGFNSKSNFNAAFKKFTGRSPKEYRPPVRQKHD